MTWLAAVWLVAAPGSAEPTQLPAPTTSQAVRFEADRFAYDRSLSLMHLDGNVKIHDSTWTIRARELWLDMESRVGRAQGPLWVEDGLNTVEGSSGAFNFGTREGAVEGALAAYAPWRVKGREATVDASRELWYRDAYFTSCDENPMPGSGGPPPHYYFRSARLHVVPKRYLFATNVRLVIGRVPVFYSPFIYKSLSPSHVLRTRLQPGIDRRNGEFVRTTTLYSLNPRWQGKLFLDYYSKPGPGAGNQLQFYDGEGGKGALYAYRIDDHVSRTQRWTLLGDHYQALASSVSFQGRLQAQSDPTFQNDYTRSNAFHVTQQELNSTAITRHTATTTLRLAYAREDDQNPAQPARFLKSSESLPRLDFRTMPLKPFNLPALHTFTAFADNNYSVARGFQQKSAGGGWEINQTIPVVRGVSLTPRGALGETFQDRFDELTVLGSTTTQRDAFVTRYDAGATLRVASWLGDSDLMHLYTRRLAASRADLDVGAPDRGVESNLLSLVHGLRPTPRIYTRLSTGYDFRVLRTQTVGFRDRVQPFGADVMLILPRQWDLELHEDYALDAGNRNFLVQADWGRREAHYLRLALANVQPQQEHYFLTQEFGWGPSSGTWTLGAALRSDLETLGGVKLQAVQLFDKELVLRKEFHDFHTMFMLTSRPGGVREFNFRVNLKLEQNDAWRREVYTDYTGR